MANNDGLEGMSPLPTPLGSFASEYNNNREISFEEDFVCISEFSEQEGPVPLLIFPEDKNNRFNINNFVVKIMTVDYQNKSFDVGSDIEDTQFVMPEPTEDAYAYVHHLTLMDIYARGYVRPICMSYITRESSKIMANFSRLLAEFSKVSDLLKKGNRKVFLRDIESRMAELKQTQKALAHPANKSEHNATPTTVSEFINDLEQIHKRVRTNMRRQELILSPSPTDPSFLISPSPGTSAPLSGSMNMEVLEKLPQFLASLRTRNFDKKLRKLSELCEENYDQGIAHLQNIHTHFKRPNIVLTLEAEDLDLISPAPSLLSIGQTPVINFNWEVLGQATNTIPPRHRPTPRPHLEPASPFLSASPLPSEQLSPSAVQPPTKADEGGSSLSQLLKIHSQQEPPKKVVEEEAESDAGVWNDTLVNPLRYCNDAALEANHIDAKLECFASQLFNESRTTFGVGLLGLRDKYPFIKQLVFSILKGRPVVVLGRPLEDQQVVIEIVNACAIFVPGLSATHVEEWISDRPLRVNDFSQLKLVGISKAITKPIPKSMERYITIFDVELEKLRGPDYQGRYLRELFNTSKQWPDDDTFLAFVHLRLLDIGVKASLYYRLCCINTAPGEWGEWGGFGNGMEGLVKAASGTSVPNRFLEPPPGALVHSRSGGAILESDLRGHETKSQSDGQLNRLREIVAARTATPQDRTKLQFFQQIGADSHDAEIIEHLAEVVKEQQVMEVCPTAVRPSIRLDYTPALVFTAPNSKQNNTSMAVLRTMNRTGFTLRNMRSTTPNNNSVDTTTPNSNSANNDLRPH